MPKSHEIAHLMITEKTLSTVLHKNFCCGYSLRVLGEAILKNTYNMFVCKNIYCGSH